MYQHFDFIYRTQSADTQIVLFLPSRTLSAAKRITLRCHTSVCVCEGRGGGYVVARCVYGGNWYFGAHIAVLRCNLCVSKPTMFGETN